MSEFSTKSGGKEILFKIAQYFQPNPEAREFRWRYTEFFNEIQRREGFIKKEYDFLTGPRTLDIWLKIRQYFQRKPEAKSFGKNMADFLTESQLSDDEKISRCSLWRIFEDKFGNLYTWLPQNSFYGSEY